MHEICHDFDTIAQSETIGTTCKVIICCLIYERIYFSSMQKSFPQYVEIFFSSKHESFFNIT